MQIFDLVGQYNSATARQEMTGTKGIKKLVSTLRDMKSGNVFEGTVNSVKGGKVVLGLPNGQEVTARMDGKVPLTVGQSMFFQVKSNDGSQLMIRPYTVEGNSMNLALMEALKAANLMVDGRNLSMVNAMMEEQMSIDRNNLAQMARIVSGNPDVDVKTLVQMQKLDIPITPEMSSQFQNYMDDKQAISHALNDFMEELPNALANSELSAEVLGKTANDVIQILTDGLAEEIPMPVSSTLNMSAPDANADVAGTVAGNDLAQSGVSELAGANENTHGTVNTETAGNLPGVNVEDLPVAGQMTSANLSNGAAIPQTDALARQSGAMPTAGDALEQLLSQAGDGVQISLSTEVNGMQGQPAPVIDEQFLQAELSSGNEQGEIQSYPEHTLGSVLDKEQLQNLNRQLMELSPQIENENPLSNLHLSETTSSVSVLNVLKAHLQAGTMDKDSILSLLSGKEFKALVKDAMEQQWTIKPEEFSQKDKITKLYEKMESQLTKLEDAVKASGQPAENVSQLASDIRNNIQFMDQINQAYTYVQVPLKMAGQNASGELYVYTNKKNLAEGKDELSAFLHLDMDHLGSTDVSVKMRGKDVSTNFYFDNDESFALVQSHAPILEARLKAKGYNCKINVTNEQKKVNFVEDFMKKEKPSSGLVHRYSFDMRA